MRYNIFSTTPPQEPGIGHGTEFLKFLSSKASAKMHHQLPASCKDYSDYYLQTKLISSADEKQAVRS